MFDKKKCFGIVKEDVSLSINNLSAFIYLIKKGK